MARRRRVLILYVNPLFAASLKSLLEKEEGLEVVTAEALGCQEPQALLSFRPHVLIVEESATLSQEGVHIHSRVPTVIRLSLTNNTMRVSHKRQISSAGAQELIAAIKGRRSTPKVADSG